MSAYRSSASPCKKGDTLHVGLLTVNTSDVPTNADATPTVTAYLGADLAGKTNPITAFTVTAVTGESGAYDITRVTTDLTAGTVIHLLVAYLISTAARRQFIDVLIA